MVLDPAELATLTDRHGDTPQRLVTERAAIERFLRDWDAFKHLVPSAVRAVLVPHVADLKATIASTGIGS